MYKDGGTIEISTDKGVYCFDNRLFSQTKGKLYDGYPKKDNSNLIENSKDLENEIVECLKFYKNDFYQNTINYILKTKTNN
jgi:hypothetical protein